MYGRGILTKNERRGDEPGKNVEPPGAQAAKGRICLIATERIEPNPAQPRKNFSPDAIFRLADSIRRYGILQPLTVRRPEGDGAWNPHPRYELIAGERRLRAARQIGMENVPCIIIEADSRMSAELAIIENLQREELNIFEEASALAALIDLYGVTQEELAARLSTSQSYIANKLRLLRLTAPERELLLDGGLTERHARALLRLPEPEKRMDALRRILAQGMNVAAAEAYIEKLLRVSEEPKAEDRRQKIILRDLRIFYNTIDRALETLKRCGISAKSERTSPGEGITEIVIRLGE